MTTHTQTEAKSTTTLIPAMQPTHSGLLLQQEQEEPDCSLLPTEDWRRSPSSPTPPPRNPSVGHSFGSMAIGSPSTPMLQRKLAIGQPNDQYEQEADRVADQVMRMPAPKVQRLCPECKEELQRQPMAEEEKKEDEEALQTKSLAETITPLIQRQMEPTEEEKEKEDETLQTKPLAETITPLIQRQTEPTEEEKKKNEETLQTKPTSGEPPTVSSGLQNQITALQGGGQPLPESERNFFEPRFGTDFSQVRIHADSQAAEAARAVNARAFTLGRDVVFGAGEYQPRSPEGQRLLAHELTHVVQQNSSVVQRLIHQSSMHPELLLIQRQKKADEFPGYSQGNAVTCGAASLITALMIWDKERKSPNAPNEMVVTASNIILTHMDDNKTALIAGWNAQGNKGDDLYNDAFTELTRIRDDARKPGAKIPESDYQLISGILFILFRNQASGGLSKPEIWSIQAKLGLASNVQSATQAQSFDDLFTDPLLTGLKPGQIAQVFWYHQDRQGNPIVSPVHIFLVGRFQRGAWFLSDQGNSPPTELEAATPQGLGITLRLEVQAGRASIYTGAKPLLLPLPFTGIVLLGERVALSKEAENIILRPGTFIAEVDASAIWSGEKLYAWDFIDRRYSFADAELAFNSSGTGHGGLIIEKPLGLFHIFKTNPVEKKHNLNATSIDEGDSKGGYLMQKSRYYHAWLKLCLKSSCNPSFFKVR